MKTNTMTTAYATLMAYVKRNRSGSKFDGNTIRERLSNVSGLRKSQFGGIVNKAIRNGIIIKVGETNSNISNHKSGKVGVYTRTAASYTR